MRNNNKEYKSSRCRTGSSKQIKEVETIGKEAEFGKPEAFKKEMKLIVPNIVRFAVLVGAY